MKESLDFTFLVIDTCRNEIEQNLSATISSVVNKAYKTLSIPIKRAEYILQLKGITIPEDNNAVDKEFLFEIMERNEEVGRKWKSLAVVMISGNDILIGTFRSRMPTMWTI